MPTLPSALSAVSLAQQIVTAFTGGALLLGDMEFVEFELPEQITYGGQQQITTHKLPGGARVLDDMGGDPAAIAWSGLFLGPLSSIRSAQLQAMLGSGPVDLAFSDRLFTVQLSEVKLTGMYGRINYSVSCIVIPDVQQDESTDDPDLDDGEAPATPEATQQEAQTKVARARAVAPTLPVPPIPPAVHS